MLAAAVAWRGAGWRAGGLLAVGLAPAVAGGGPGAAGGVAGGNVHNMCVGVLAMACYVVFFIYIYLPSPLLLPLVFDPQASAWGST